MAVVTTGHAWGDPRVFERNLASCLAWGLEVHVFVPLAELPERVGWSAASGLRIHALAPPKGRLGRALLAWVACLRVLRAGPFALVQFHDPELVPAMGLLALLSPATYTLYDIHEDLPLQVESKHYLPPWLRRSLGWLTRWMLRIAAGLFHGFAPATESIAQDWPAAQSRVLHNYPKAVFALGPGGAPDPQRVLYVGGLAEGRGILMVLAAMAEVRRHLPGVRLELVGPVLEPAVGEAVAAAVAAGWCLHLPWLAPEALAGHAAGAGVGLVTLLPQPNYLESLPTKLFEYMAMGIPVLASAFPLWRQLVEEAGAGRVVEPEAAAVARALLTLLSDPPGLRRMGAAGQAAYQHRYRWETEAGNLRWHLLQAGLQPSS